MTKYIQTNEHGYVTNVIEEPLLIGLFGGKNYREIPDEQADEVKSLIEQYKTNRDGIHIDNLNKILDSPINN